MEIFEVKLTPVVGCEVSPLEDTLRAGQVTRQLEPDGEDLVPGGREVLGPLAVGLLEEVPVQTGLGGGHQGVVLRTQPELEVAHVVGGELDPDLDALVLLVYPGDRPPPELPAPLVVPGLLLVRDSSSIFLIIVIVIIIINIVIIIIFIILYIYIL